MTLDPEPAGYPADPDAEAIAQALAQLNRTDVTPAQAREFAGYVLHARQAVADAEEAVRRAAYEAERAAFLATALAEFEAGR